LINFLHLNDQNIPFSFSLVISNAFYCSQNFWNFYHRRNSVKNFYFDDIYSQLDDIDSGLYDIEYDKRNRIRKKRAEFESL